MNGDLNNISPYSRNWTFQHLENHTELKFLYMDQLRANVINADELVLNKLNWELDVS